MYARRPSSPANSTLSYKERSKDFLLFPFSAHSFALLQKSPTKIENQIGSQNGMTNINTPIIFGPRLWFFPTPDLSYYILFTLLVIPVISGNLNKHIFSNLYPKHLTLMSTCLFFYSWLHTWVEQKSVLLLTVPSRIE